MVDKALNVKIGVGVTGGDQPAKLQQSIDGVSDAAKALDADAAKLNGQLVELGRKQAAADAFKQLTRETQAANKALQDAVSQVDALGAELLPVADKARQLAEAEKATAAALAAAKADLVAKREGLRALREEYTGAARKTEEYTQAEAALQVGIGAGKKAVAEKQTALRQAALATAEAEAAERKLSGEYNKAVSAAGALSTQLGQRREALEQTRTTMQALGVATTGLAETEKQLAAATRDTKAQLVEVAAAHRTLAAQQRDMKTVGVESHAAIAKQVAETKAAFDRLKASGKLTGAELAQAALQAELRVRELNKQTGDLVHTLGEAKGAVVGLAAAGAGLTVVSKAAITFESAMADVRKVVEGTDEQIADLATALKKLSAEEIPLTAEGLAKIAAAGGQIGVPIEKLTEFTRLAATMATAFDMSAEEAGTAVAKLTNNFELPLEGVRALGDAINVLGNTTAAKEKDIIDVLTRVGGMATQFGLSAQQTSALAATMLSLGTTSEVVSTGLNALMGKLQTAAEGTKDFREGLASIGIDARKLARDVRDHPQQALLEFLATLEQLDKKTRAEILTKLFGQEYQDDLARLVKAAGQYRENLAKIADETRTAGSMQREFGERSKTTANQLQLLENSVKALAINIGNVLLPVINPVAEGLRDIAGGAAEFAGKNPEITAIATAAATALATIGGLRLAMLAVGAAGRLAFGDVAGMVGSALKPMGEAVAAVGKLQAAFGVLSAGLIGWEFGELLASRFEEARLAGVAVAQAIFEIAEEVQFRWEQMRAVISGDDLADVGIEHQRRLNEIRSIYADLAAEATDSARAQKKASADASEAAAKAGSDTAKAAAAAGLAAEDAGKQTAGAAASAAAAIKPVEDAFSRAAAAATKAGAAGEEAMTKATAAAKVAGPSWAELSGAANGLGVSLQALGTEVGEGVKAAQDHFGTLLQGLGTLKARGIDTGAVVRQAIAGMIAKAETVADLDSIRDGLAAMTRERRIAGADFAISLDLMRDKAVSLREAIDENTPGLQSLRKAAAATGVDFDQLTTGVSAGLRKGVEGVEDLILQMSAAGVQASKASPILSAALDKQIEAAKTKEEIQLVRAAVDQAAKSGVLFGDAAKEALEKVQAKAMGLRDTYFAIFKDQERYLKLLKESAAYGPGASGGLGTLGDGASLRERNDAVKSIIDKSEMRTATPTQYTPPDNSGDWTFDAPAYNLAMNGSGYRGVGSAINTGGPQTNVAQYWKLSEAGAARRESARLQAIADAYTATGQQMPNGQQPITLGNADVVAWLLAHGFDRGGNLATQFASEEQRRAWVAAQPVQATKSPSSAAAAAEPASSSSAATPTSTAAADTTGLAARLDQLINTLQAGGAMQRHEVVLRDANGASQTISVSGEGDVSTLLDVLRRAAARA